MSLSARVSFAECSARERIALLFDEGSFTEWLPPAARVMSPHLAQLGVPAAFDDGVAIGSARLDGHCVFIAAQEGEFMGGGVGEVHGAKLVGLFKRALGDRPAARVAGKRTLSGRRIGIVSPSTLWRTDTWGSRGRPDAPRPVPCAARRTTDCNPLRLQLKVTR